jgi:hypothetical protein
LVLVVDDVCVVVWSVEQWILCEEWGLVVEVAEEEEVGNLGWRTLL